MTAKGEVHMTEAFQYVQLILLVDGVIYHLWRVMHHLSVEDLDISHLAQQDRI